MSTVSQSAVIRRIRRALARKGERLCISRSYGERSNLGDAYVVNDRNVVVAWRCTIAGLASELGVLGTREEMAA